MTASPKTDLFKQAADLWDLERLYADLATVKGEELSDTEALHLRGLLCGYNSATIARKLHRSVRGTQADISSHINQYVKELVNQRQPASKPLKTLNSAGDIMELLEELGYRKKSSVSTEELRIQLEAATGGVLLSKLSDRVTFNFYQVCNSSVSVSFPTEVAKQLSEALVKVLATSSSEGGGGEKKDK